MDESGGADRGGQEPRLQRVVGVPGGVLLGLGSILGTGIFVSLGIAAATTGASVVLAVVLAAAVAMCNGLSSAQLAASHPVSGGTYEYGYRYLGPTAGFLAGWTFLCAKSASAATAALGFAGYLLTATGASTTAARVAVGLGLVVALTAVVTAGLRRSNHLNTLVVGLTLAGLGAFVVAGLPTLLAAGTTPFRPFLAPRAADGGGLPALLEATALMFVAFTGYGRIATLGEEIRDPRRSIPRAIIGTLVATLLLYLAVSAVAVSVAGADGLAGATRGAVAPLEVVARRMAPWWLPAVVGLAAVTAMAGVLLNLLLGLSRVLLAMARRGDVPRGLAHLRGRSASPVAAVTTVGILVAALVLVGDVHTTWSFSAFTVLVYYALTNLAALRLPPTDRRFPRWVSWAGLMGCLGLAFWVDAKVWSVGLGVLAIGFVWHRVARRFSGE